MKKRKTIFDETLELNVATYMFYLNHLTELSMTMFEWVNLPATIDPRFLEMVLLEEGQAIFFKDETLGYLALQVTNASGLNVYRIPINRRAYAVNGYQCDLTIEDSVIIYNNYLHNNSILDIRLFANRLYELDRIISVNANSQKTPTLLQSTEQQRLSLLNIYKEYEGNSPVIFGDKDLDINGIKSINTQAPYVADKIYQLKTQIWNEALTYLGISNLNIQKKERVLSDEVSRSMGGTMASRYSRLEARREACRKINDMFGLNIWCNYRTDVEDDTSIGGVGSE